MKPPISGQSPPTSNVSVAFDRGSAERIGSVVKYVEGYYRNPPPKDPLPPRGGGGSAIVLVVTATIGAKTGSTAGSGTAKIATFDPSTKAMGTGTGPDLTIYNYHEKTFVVGAFISAFPWMNGLWVFDVDKCGNYV